MSKKITRILIANRGEIACRIIRTCQQLGIEAIAVYSHADRHARHVQLADVSECVGEAAPVNSYLNIEAILAAAWKHQADAIHPGYGFLAENPDFAQACADNGLIFIGAPVAAMRLMASKSAAKRTMEAAGVACVPGYHGDNQEPDFLFEQARQIGWPVLIKASAGGGGKGMKIVHDADAFHEALASAKSEARKAFGNDQVILEKFIARPRHLEVQVFSDRHGQHVHLFERDCSAQRRYQKIIEEAPAAGLSDQTRHAMHAAAVKAAQAVSYEGAGTVEFILDQDESFYFLEMNTRLQVEHRVTELITSTDLVAWQIRVAEGHPLPISQDDIRCKGHVIEARIYAEDDSNDFLPSVGLLDRLRFPAERPERLIVDTGVRQSDRISIHYDPMIAKLVVWGEDRNKAIAAMNQALAKTLVSCVKTNLPTLTTLINHPHFLANRLYTNAIDQGLLEQQTTDHWPCVAATVGHCLLAVEEPGQPGWQAFGPSWQRLWLRHKDKDIVVDYCLANETLHLHAVSPESPITQGFVSAGEEEKIYRWPWPLPWDAVIHETPTAFHVTLDTVRCVFEKKAHNASDTVGGAGHEIVAPMPGQVLQVLVKPGESVRKGQTLIVMEAMKMELSLKAPRDGQVASLTHAVGDVVSAGDVLLRLEETGIEHVTGEPA